MVFMISKILLVSVFGDFCKLVLVLDNNITRKKKNFAKRQVLFVKPNQISIARENDCILCISA